jgi:virulence factor Mce-like protein
VTDHLGPGHLHRSETESASSPVAASPGQHFGARLDVRPLVGLGMVVAIGLIIALAVGLFRGSFTETVPITVLSPRAGLVMNPDARVNMRGVQVGKVASIEALPDGQAALHLTIDPKQLHLIPSNVRVDISSSTVFGAKFVELVPPADPSPKPMFAGQVLDAATVTVEINTLFDELTSVLSKIAPEKLNETLGAIASALNGRGQKIGQTLSDLDNLLAQLDPSLDNLRHDIATAPDVLRAYADSGQNLISTIDNATTISQTIVDEQQNLDALLLSAIGLADIGNQVLGDNRNALTDVLQLLVPTTDLLNEYNPALTCTLQGIIPIAKAAPMQYPGVYTMASFLWGAERYRYPSDLPKVAATGGPHCQDVGLPRVPFEGRPPYVLGDIGVNPFKYNNQGVLVNSDLLKQILFGPIDGPPRNSAQIGQPG